MPKTDSPYGYRYEQERARVLAGNPVCVHCAAEGRQVPATETDHQPPVSLHMHRQGSGCCRLVPSCGPHARSQGGTLRAASADGLVPDVVEEPDAGFGVDDPVWQVAWLADLLDVPANATWPRFMTVPHPKAVGSYGEQFEEWSRTSFGVELRWFQRLVARRLLEHDADGHLVWITLILTLARQLGKSTLLASLLAWRLVHGAEMFGEVQLLLHTARDVGVAREVQLHARTWAQARPDTFKVIEANGKEMIQHKPSGSRWLVKAEGAVFGYSATCGLVDECWDVKVRTVKDGITRTLVAHNQPQLLLTSTARGGEEATSLFPNHRASAVFALAQPARDLFIEWSAPRGCELGDRDAWRMASPHWDQAREDSIAESVEDAELLGDPDLIDAVRTQDLNIWPGRGGAVGPTEILLPAGAWASCPPPPADREVVRMWAAVEDNYGLGAGVVAVAQLDDGRYEVDAWLCASVSAAVKLVDRLADAHEVPVTRLEGALIRSRRPVTRVGASELRAGLQQVRAAIAARQIVHDPVTPLDDQLDLVRVREGAGGLTMAQLPGKRTDLVRALAWALGEALTNNPEPAIH